MLEPGAALTVRLVTARDAPLVRALMLAGFEQFREVLDPPSGAFAETDEDVAAAIGRGGAAVAWLGETPVGSVRFEPEESWLYIGRLAVIPEARRRGVARALVLAAEAEAAALRRDRGAALDAGSPPWQSRAFRRAGLRGDRGRSSPSEPGAKHVAAAEGTELALFGYHDRLSHEGVRQAKDRVGSRLVEGVGKGLSGRQKGEAKS